MKTIGSLCCLLACSVAAADGFPAKPVLEKARALAAQGASLAKAVATKASDGHTIWAKVGGRLEVWLPAQLGTGYGWDVVESDPKLLEQQGRPTVGQIDPGRGMGRQEMEVFVFSVKATGQSKLKLVYRRPWMKSEPPADTFGITVVAK